VHDSLERQAQTARAAIVSGGLRGAELIELIEAVPVLDRNEWVDAVLGMDPPPADRNLPRGGVPYLPCGVDEIIEAVRDAPVRAEDVFVDLGSGLGRVAILASLISGARSCGIEIQEHLVDAARACSLALHLPEVSFVHGDASEADLEGSVFFMYAPFNGDLLRRVLARLEARARQHPIVVCTVGMALSEAPWMVPRATSSVALTIHDLRQ
jgi:SAM-dependent methyltransferase